MRARLVLIAMASAVALAVAGCASSIEGSPVAAVSPLPLPADEAPGGAELPDLGGLSDGSDDMPDLSDLFDGTELPDFSDLPDISGLLDGNDLPDGGDLSGLLDQLQDGAGGDLSGLLNSECMQAATLSMGVGSLFLKPMMGQPLTADDIDSAFQAANQLPAELHNDLATLKSLAESVVGKPAAEAMQLMQSPAVNDAMDGISAYLDAHCGSN